MMHLFVTNDEVAQWETQLPGSAQRHRLELLLHLSWHLRQRDTGRALLLADEAKALLTSLTPLALTELTARRLKARMMLVHAEAKWLNSEFGTAREICRAALAIFTLSDDREGNQGCADTHFLLANIAYGQGNMTDFESEIALARSYAKKGDDALRERFMDAELALKTVLHDLPLAILRWDNHWHSESEESPVLLAVINDFLLCSSSLSGNFGHAATCGIQAYEHALHTGQIRRAISAASNVGDAFNSLNDHQTALFWMQAGLDLARKTGWQLSIGSCETQMAETLRRLGRLDAAKEMLETAIPAISKLTSSRYPLLALRYLGDVLLDQGEHLAALRCFQELQDKSDARGQLDFRIGSRRGRAYALSLLGEPKQALALAGEALLLAEQSNNAYSQIAVLRVLASIHTHHQLPAPNGMLVASAPLHYLQQALEAAHTINGYTIQGELLEQVADAHAASGNYQEAFRLSRLAISAREKIHTQEATNRATAVQVSHQTERMRAEAEHLRQLADAEAQRIDVLQKNSSVLELLGTIGQEITASLDVQAVFQTLNRHAHGLLHVTAFAIYLMDPDQQGMSAAFGMENGVPIDIGSVQMSDQHANSVRCVKLRREILIEFIQDDQVPNIIPGTELVLSMLYAPLIIADKVLGVMTIQSSREHAYAEREKMIFRSLCAFGAIALSNADAYLRLKETQAYLVTQEKLAALGSLVAGVAHELNTPIGNCLLVASTVQDNTKNVLDKLAQQSLRRSELQTFCNEVQSSSEIVLRGLSSAAALISSFKQVAVDRTSEQRRPFDLRQVLQDIIATLNIRISHAGHAIGLDVPAGVKMDSYPGSLGQVITNLIENAILHAFDEAQSGIITISVLPPDSQRVLIQFNDNGGGIPEENLKRIFDPFFTTKLGQGGSGLGLHICYNIVSSILHGQLTVRSSPDSGTTFSLDLPLVA